jgi:hypothetical protein
MDGESKPVVVKAEHIAYSGLGLNEVVSGEDLISL